MVTSEHMNCLLKNVLKLIKKNIGNDNAPWMTQIAGKLSYVNLPYIILMLLLIQIIIVFIF